MAISFLQTQGGSGGLAITVSVNSDDLAKIKSMLGTISNGTQKALSQAINETLPGVRTDIVAELQTEVNIPKSVLLHGPVHYSTNRITGAVTKSGPHPTFVIKRSKPNDLHAFVETTGANIPLVYYRTAPKVITTHKVKIIKVQVSKSKPEETLRHAFIPKLKSGYKGIYMRKGKSRYPIKELFGPRLPDILSNPKPLGNVIKKSDVRLSKNITRAIDRILARAANV